MVSSRTYFLVGLALFVFCFGLAAKLQPQFQAMPLSRAKGDILNVVLGDSRRLFANEIYVKADAYYHSGYYPTMFDDNAAFKTAHMAEDTGAVNSKNKGDEEGFLGPKRNWIDAFSRHFFPDRHSHLDEGGPTDELGKSDQVREILPWLKLSADLDPDNVQTYTVTAFWLRERMHKVAEADAVLHEGLRNCPDSYDILFELGRLYDESYHDKDRARNVWEAAARKWNQLDPATQKDNQLIMEQIATHLAKLEEDAGNLPRAVEWFQVAQKVSMTRDAIQIQINRLKGKILEDFNPLMKPLY
jgi:tetratricopeptide (TPR) repeat protein